MLNSVNLCGRLVKDPELRTTSSGTSVTTFSIAVDRDYTSGEEKQTDFINCVAWRNTAEFISKFFRKGKLIIVNGRLQTRKYTTQNGENRIVTEVTAESVYFAGDKSKDELNGNYEPNQSIPTGFVAVPDNEIDLPF